MLLMCCIKIANAKQAFQAYDVLVKRQKTSAMKCASVSDVQIVHTGLVKAVALMKIIRMT